MRKQPKPKRRVKKSNKLGKPSKEEAIKIEAAKYSKRTAEIIVHDRTENQKMLDAKQMELTGVTEAFKKARLRFGIILLIMLAIIITESILLVN